LIFLDINTFYGPRAGGIRTYHDAKIAAFSRQSEHSYCLIHPGPVARVDRPSPRVTLVQVPGIALTSDPLGYRLIVNYLPVVRWIRALRPDVIEAGDAWLTAWFCLLLRPMGLWFGPRVSFYHSDPVPTYLEPWSRRGGFLRKSLVSWAAGAFYRLQARFDGTGVASRGLADALRRRGVENVRVLPFGAHPDCFAAAEPSIPLRRGGHAAPARFLYAGRLDRDKDAGLLLDILPRLLEDPDVFVTVAGRGALAKDFAAFSHPRYRFAGFVEGLEGMAALYAAHDALLAPGPYETFGMAVLEAMAAGLAVIGPDAGGAGELLREAGSPFVFAAGDAGDFLRQARRAAKSDLAAASADAREAAARYGTWDDAVARMIDAWKETVR
jgi:alpha-1,6-mannosyltransferase